MPAYQSDKAEFLTRKVYSVCSKCYATCEFRLKNWTYTILAEVHFSRTYCLATKLRLSKLPVAFDYNYALRIRV